MRFSKLGSAALILLLPMIAFSEQRQAQQVFDEIKGRAGRWYSLDPDSTTVVDIKVIANGSAVVETWGINPTSQSMTVYVMDGERLLATHYCPHGNAPRLIYRDTDTSGAHHFIFLDGANLHLSDAKHEHAFWVRADANGGFTRNEVYIKKHL